MLFYSTAYVCVRVRVRVQSSVKCVVSQEPSRDDLNVLRSVVSGNSLHTRHTQHQFII